MYTNQPFDPTTEEVVKLLTCNVIYALMFFNYPIVFVVSESLFYIMYHQQSFRHNYVVFTYVLVSTVLQID